MQKISSISSLKIHIFNLKIKLFQYIRLVSVRHKLFLPNTLQIYFKHLSEDPLFEERFFVK